MKPDVLYQTAKRKILDALPDILFFLFLFYAILVLFGVQYVIVVSFVTLLYKIRRKRKQTPRRLCIMFFVQMALSILAFLASHSLLACVLLNIAVPFLLVFLQSSQFNQKGYMASAMGFVFLQLRPIPYTDFMTYLLVMACSLGFAVCCLLLSSYGHRREDDYALARKGIALLQEQMDAYLKQKTDQQRKEELVNIQRLLYKQAYQSRGFTYIATKEGRLRYLFALLLQRSSYFLENMDNIPVCSEQQQVLLQRCMQFLKHAENFNCTDNSMLLEEGQKLFTACRKKQDAVSLFLHNFLQLFLQILKDLQDNKKEAVHREWKLPEERKLRNRLRMDSFEFRFASRLSLVLLCGFLFARLSKLDHSYWLVLNAFLLLQPMYEESAYRLKTRFIGTVFGCTVIYLVLPHFPGVAGHFLFASIVVSLMYCATLGTWIQAMFSTCFAITLTSLAMRETIAIEMRLTYVAVAILLVLIVNRFFFPTSRSGLFQANMKRMFHMQHSYLRILQGSLHAPLDYGIIMDALTSFHMVYDQILEYLQGSSENIELYRHLLSAFWHMSVEMEQMIFTVQHDTLTEDQEQSVEQFIHMCDTMIQSCEVGKTVQKEKREFLTEDVSDNELFQLMQRYYRHASDISSICLSRQL
ncbi:FUSC family protein [[Clostridium] innocuum]|nr:FUSC family protein [[Clostridium] innocuum]